LVGPSDRTAVVRAQYGSVARGGGRVGNVPDGALGSRRPRSRSAVDNLPVVLGRHVERLEFLDVMFGDRPALSPSEIFYQRMLAEDPAEAVDKAEEFLKEGSLSTYYDEVALPGLRLAQSDIVRGSLDRAQSEKIKTAVVELVDDLIDYDDGKLASGTTSN
jgi:hypothetical protein